jgi:hypothetical protein
MTKQKANRRNCVRSENPIHERIHFDNLVCEFVCESNPPFDKIGYHMLFRIVSTREVCCCFLWSRMSYSGTHYWIWNSPKKNSRKMKTNSKFDSPFVNAARLDSKFAGGAARCIGRRDSRGKERIQIRSAIFEVGGYKTL